MFAFIAYSLLTHAFIASDGVKLEWQVDNNYLSWKTSEGLIYFIYLLSPPPCLPLLSFIIKCRLQ